MSIESAIKAIHAAGLSDTQSEKFLSNDHLRRIVEVALAHGSSEQDAKDASRYRWIRDVPEGHPAEEIGNMPGDMWDRMIDEYMREEA